MLLQKSLIHATEYIDVLIVKRAATEVVASFLHISAHLPLRDYFVLLAFDTHISEGIIADLN